MSTTVDSKVTWAEDAPAWLRYWFPLVRFIVEYPAGHSINEMEDIQNVFACTYLEERSMSFFHGFSWHVRSIYPTPLFLHEYAHLIVPEHDHDEIYLEVERGLWEDWGFRKSTDDYYEVLRDAAGRHRLRLDRTRLLLETE